MPATRYEETRFISMAYPISVRNPALRPFNRHGLERDATLRYPQVGGGYLVLTLCSLPLAFFPRCNRDESSPHGFHPT